MKNPYRDFSNIDPQPNMQFRQVENSIWQALVHAGFSGPEYQLIFCVIDKTWGFNKTSDAISLSQFVVATRLEKRNVFKYLARLEERRVIIIERHRGRGQVSNYMFNKHWDTWKLNGTLAKDAMETPSEEKVSGGHLLAVKGVDGTPLEKGVGGTPFNGKKGVNPAQKGVGPAQEKGVYYTPTKETYKRNSSKESSNTDTPSSESFQLAKLLKNLILTNNAKAKTPQDLTKWALDIDKMIRIDKRTPEEIKAIIKFSQGDSFWCANILSAGKLREKFDQLYLKAREKEKNSAEKKERGGSHGSGGEQQPGRGAPPHQRGTGGGRQPGRWNAIESGPDDTDED